MRDSTSSHSSQAVTFAAHMDLPYTMSMDLQFLIIRDYPRQKSTAAVARNRILYLGHFWFFVQANIWC
jgi:hypothetical protein